MTEYCRTCNSITSAKVGCRCDYGVEPEIGYCVECHEINEICNLDGVSRCDECVEKSNKRFCIGCEKLVNLDDMNIKRGNIIDVYCEDCYHAKKAKKLSKVKCCYQTKK